MVSMSVSRYRFSPANKPTCRLEKNRAGRDSWNGMGRLGVAPFENYSDVILRSAKVSLASGQGG